MKAQILKPNGTVVVEPLRFENLSANQIVEQEQLVRLGIAIGKFAKLDKAAKAINLIHSLDAEKTTKFLQNNKDWIK